MRRVPVLFFLVLAWSARGAIYENPIAVDSEDDLIELEQRGDISEDTSDTLMELMREGVDLNGADREQLYDLPGLTYADVDAVIEYRKAKGRIDDPTELVGAGALTEDQLIQIAPFIRIDAAKPILPVGGKIHLQSRFTTTDNVPPPAMLTARLRGPYNLSAGFMAFTTRRRASTPVYDETTDALKSAGFLYQPQLTRIFLQWKPSNFRVVAGTFTIGFGERLTLDNTRRVTPRGIYLIDDYRRVTDLTQTCKLSAAGLLADPTSGCDLDGGKNLYITPDYKYRDVFRGVAVSAEDLSLGGDATISLYGFGSFQQRSIYQYELFDRRYCDDPRNDNDSACTSPPIYLNDGQTRLIFSTLNNMFNELTGGGHVTFKPTYRVTIGATGWAAMPFFPQQPMQLDFQEYSRYPTGGAFGAVGLDAKTGFDQFRFFLEATHNFDGRLASKKMGGWGVEQRTTFSPKKHEFELSLRLYDPGFGTPYARPIASPDLLEGQRARNEAGVRLRWVGNWSKDWSTRIQVNLWVNPWALDEKSEPVLGNDPTTTVTQPAGIFNMWALARIDFNGWKFFQPAVWVDVRNRNLASSEHGTCASGSVLVTDGAPYTCSGDYYRIAARMDFFPRNRLFSASLQGYLTWRDDFRYKDRFRNDFQVWAEVRSTPTDWLQLRARTRYLNQDTEDNAYLETSSWSFIEAAWLITKGTRIALRYDLYVWLDQRSSTLNRIPNPEHRFQLDARVAF
ncbi:MAG: helix-hairpin-helix domain-containing protein [Archangium sp.]